MTIKELQPGDIVQSKDGRNYVVLSAAHGKPLVCRYTALEGFSGLIQIIRPNEWALAKRHDWSKPMEEIER